MTRLFTAVFATLLLAFGFNAAAAAPGAKGTAAEAQAMVDKAIAFIKKNGREKGFAEINNKSGQFTDRDLYVFVYDMKGKVLAHGSNAKLIGKDVLELRDVDGKYYVKERVEMMSKGPDAKGWQDYKYMNPVSRQIEQKSAYLHRYEDMIIGCGIYK
jgi:cytochrome c